ncbi:hypothetical protein N7445_007782 [Penicillium cf. griseofulvum]|nr:hypothetical protein N7445_007782 [Penicillium cf. griseofulvum]
MSVHTAIICPPIIYGSGRGTGNTKSAKAYWLAAAVLKRRNGLLIGEGKKIWHQGITSRKNGTFIWGDIQLEVARVAYEKKLIPSPEVEPLSDTLEPLSDTQASEPDKFRLYAFGTSSR